jgi:uncharacterized protein
MPRTKSGIRKHATRAARGISGMKEMREPGARYLGAEKAISAMFRNARYGTLLVDIIASPAFQRLKDIRFLGAIDYMLVPNGTPKHRRHTRYEHSLNVARLAQAYARSTKLDEYHEKHLVIAALLHDVGHGPLSHSLEPVFKDRFRLTHHEATVLILRGIVPIGALLPQIFKNHGIDRKHVVALIEGNATGVHAEALLNPINVDTIEGILRSYSYLVPEDRHLTPVRILHSLLQRSDADVRVLDDFWERKDFVYEHLINSRLGLAADYVCQEYARRNAARFWSGNYFITESALRRQHKDLFLLLEYLRSHRQSITAGGNVRLSYDRRRFYVDTKVHLADWPATYKRYKQTKIPAAIQIADTFAEAEVGTKLRAVVKRDLFALGETNGSSNSRRRAV